MTTIQDALDTVRRNLELNHRGELLRWKGEADRFVVMWRQDAERAGVPERLYRVHGLNIYNASLYSGSWDLTEDEAREVFDQG
jgi:hypothetical protein